MISMVGIKNILVLAIAFLTFSVNSQVTNAKIVFERKTNLEKMFKDNPRVKPFLKEGVKYKIENFNLYINDSCSVFLPIESDEPEQGFMKYLTSHNKVYQNFNQDNKLVIMDMWGQETYLQDSISVRQWKVTESKRKIGGYLCTKAIWEMDDSTRIYAWFSPDIVLSTGPEGFGGLPGTILGLATENGTIIYFAKEVVVEQAPEGILTASTKGKDVYTVAELKKLLTEKMGQWVKPKDLDAMFSWL
jgi:GLPGLI family protein